MYRLLGTSASRLEGDDFSFDFHVPAVADAAASSAAAVPPPADAADTSRTWRLRAFRCPEGLRLFRQRAFKGEALVPVVPSAYVFIVVPISPAVAANPERAAAKFASFLDRLYYPPPAAPDAVGVQPLDDVDRPPKELSLERCGDITLFTSPSQPVAVAVVDLSQLAARDPDQSNPYSTSNVALDLLDRVAAAAHPFDAVAGSDALGPAKVDAGSPRTQAAVSAAMAAMGATDDFPSAEPLPSTLCAWAAAGDGRPASEVGLAAPGSASFDAEYYELPTCLACLDRLERHVSGVAAGDHICRCPDDACHCIAAAANAGCKVCRALLTATPATMPECVECGAADESTWVCLVCGRVGCSRYNGQHAQQHFLRTGHELTVNVATQQIWDYRGDAFAHRLLVRVLPAALGAAPDAHDDHADTGGAAGPKPESPVSPGVPSGAGFGSSGTLGAVAKMHLPQPQSIGRGGKLLDAGDRQPSDAGSGASPLGGPDDRAGRYVEDRATTKTLVDAKLETKVEQLCLEYSRELAAALDTQRRTYEATIAANTEAAARAVGLPATVPGVHVDPTAASRGTTTASATTSTSAVPVAASASQSLNLQRETNEYTKAVKANAAAFAAEKAVLAKRRALEAEEASLLKTQAALKAANQAAVLARKQSGDAVRAEVRQLREAIEEARLNLRARDRMKKAGLSSADTDGAFTFVEKGPGRRGGSRRK